MHSTLVEVLARTIEKIGVDKTIGILEKAQQEPVKFADKIVEKVVTSISDRLNISVEEIIYGVGRKNNRKIAIGFCTFYLMEVYNYDLKQIAEILNKDQTICFKYKKLITGLNPKHAADQEYIIEKNYFNSLFPKQ